MRKSNIEAVLQRLKEVLGAKSDSALAKALETTPQTLSSWKTRGSVPYAICVEISESHNVSLDWLIRGVTYRVEETEGSVREVREKSGDYETKLTPREKAVLALFNNLNPEQQKEVLRDAEEKQRITQMEAQMRELQEEMRNLKNLG